jgi:hypothetical protein
MTKRIFEYECQQKHRSESYEYYETRTIECSVCTEPADRIVSTPRIALDGVSMHFPTAADAWAPS